MIFRNIFRTLFTRNITNKAASINHIKAWTFSKTALHKKWSLISSLNMQIWSYLLKKSVMKTSFFAQCILSQLCLRKKFSVNICEILRKKSVFKITVCSGYFLRDFLSNTSVFSIKLRALLRPFTYFGNCLFLYNI